MFWDLTFSQQGRLHHLPCFIFYTHFTIFETAPTTIGIRKIIEEFNLRIEKNLLIAEINKRYNALLRSIELRDGIPELLKELKRQNIKVVGVATSTSS